MMGSYESKACSQRRDGAFPGRSRPNSVLPAISRGYHQ
jgi:hypothetical protein